LQGRGVILPRWLMLVYPRGYWGNTAWHLVLTCLVCQMSLKQVWSQLLVAAGALLFSQCNVSWRRFTRCWSFDSSWCFLSTKCDSRISTRFLSNGAHAVCFCALVTILDPRLVFSF
jgi:hypothetical protein